MVPGSDGPAVLDPQHVGDIVGALGTLKRSETGNTRSWRRKFRLLLIIVGPGLIVMGGGNDAGGVSVYAQMGQDYGMKLSYNPHLLPGRAAPRCSTPRYMAGTGTARSAAE